MPLPDAEGNAILRGYCGWDEVCKIQFEPTAIPTRGGKGIGVFHFSMMSKAKEISAYERQKFAEPAERVRATVRGGWDKAEITEGGGW